MAGSVIIGGASVSVGWFHGLGTMHGDLRAYDTRKGVQAYIDVLQAVEDEATAGAGSLLIALATEIADRPGADDRRTLAALLLDAREGTVVPPTVTFSTSSMCRLWRAGEAGWRSTRETVVAELARIGRNVALFGRLHVLNGADGDLGLLPSGGGEPGPPLRLATTKPIVRTGPPGRRATTETMCGGALAA